MLHVVKPIPNMPMRQVKKPNSLKESAFGDLREDNLKLIIKVWIY